MNEHCLNPPIDTCNICGLQFWPVGGVPFFPGNMWTAKCSYVQKLLPPSGFETQMDSVLKKAIDLQNEGRIVNGIYSSAMAGSLQHKNLFALERYASEHWIGSHPDLQPCNVSGSLAGNLFVWIRKVHNENEFVWSMAPHHPLLPTPDYWQPLRGSQIHEILKAEDRRMREYFLLPGLICTSGFISL